MRYVLVGLIALGGVTFLGATAKADLNVATAHSEAQVVGQPFPILKLTNQQDVPVQLPGEASVIVFANAKNVDEWADPLLAKFGQKQMEANHLVYLSDIHRMPWMISKMFALPKLKERTYSVALIREANQVPATIEPKVDCLNWIQLKSGTITSLAPVCNPTDLGKRLNALLLH
ncbi:MAG: hypothetical protein B7X35_02945 [Halothiobacillus sp. 14-56-357]|jgi:hypothetical protein|uniref:hypothetical protein n=1 Tax=Halothiobacillus sp. 15-55-196 TaxID=1970382 RepID=UPI000BD9686A|nr:hypothetical protein [Halothiobacillus sp. 15-55-196]OZB36757.1 MAG: hypothetical protein B7X44_04605 [Halothiobacillus sp. 15-55-196]OZB57052.1 MAG: hypothetical protein B7X35_02945 [Halothiobacillus sp. 14-56-357]OZB78402.1 MAG: hypothetical protein B7X29_04985 [Halothiobacillus sp. 13-55-115]